MTYSAANKRHRRVGHILRCLRGHGITLVRAQFAATAEHLALKTNIDAIGVSGNEVVAIELKTTQHDRRVHETDLYTRPCANQPRLANGLANTEETHHRMQIGFGVMCLRRLLGRGVRVRGVVVVSYEDEARVHEMPDRHASPAWFASDTLPLKSPAVRPAPKARKKQTQEAVARRICLPWPAEDPRVIELLRRKQVSVRVEPVCQNSHVVLVTQPGHHGLEVPAVCIALRHGDLKPGQIRALDKQLLKARQRVFGSGSNQPHRHALVLCPGKQSLWTLVPLVSTLRKP